MIEGDNDSDEEIKKECEWIKNNLGTNTPIHFSAFHPSYKFKNYPRTNSKTLLKDFTSVMTKEDNIHFMASHYVWVAITIKPVLFP